MTYTTLYKYNATTGVVSVMASGLSWGWGVAVDKYLNVYFTDDATAASGGGLYWIPYLGSKQLLKSLDYMIGVTVDSGLNIFASNGTYIFAMNPAHTSWTLWKKMYAYLDIALDSKKTAYASDFTSLDMMDDQKLVLYSTMYDENVQLDATGIYYVNWNWGYGATTGGGWVMCLPAAERPT